MFPGALFPDKTCVEYPTFVPECGTLSYDVETDVTILNNDELMPENMTSVHDNVG